MPFARREYIALATAPHNTGLRLLGYRREGEAREPFTDTAGRERALAPDAMLVMTDDAGRRFGAFVEVDLGSMSHAGLRQKAQLYAAYVETDAWHGRRPFLPTLLFLTNPASERRSSSQRSRRS